MLRRLFSFSKSTLTAMFNSLELVSLLTLCDACLPSSWAAVDGKPRGNGLLDDGRDIPHDGCARASIIPQVLLRWTALAQHALL